MARTFLQRKGDYRNLIVVRKGLCIYIVSYFFAHRFLGRFDRTVDQMVQAARSGKQNIIEGSSAGMTSRETEIKLYNVSRASYDELLADFEDYMITRAIEPWVEAQQLEVRRWCRNNVDTRLYVRIARTRDDATLVNLAITLIRQELLLLDGLINKAKKDFLRYGGIREEMSRERRKRFPN